jgi:hypothetical protein
MVWKIKKSYSGYIYERNYLESLKENYNWMFLFLPKEEWKSMLLSEMKSFSNEGIKKEFKEYCDNLNKKYDKINGNK